MYGIDNPSVFQIDKSFENRITGKVKPLAQLIDGG